MMAGPYTVVSGVLLQYSFAKEIVREEQLCISLILRLIFRS